MGEDGRPGAGQCATRQDTGPVPVADVAFAAVIDRAYAGQSRGDRLLMLKDQLDDIRRLVERKGLGAVSRRAFRVAKRV